MTSNKAPLDVFSIEHESSSMIYMSHFRLEEDGTISVDNQEVSMNSLRQSPFGVNGEYEAFTGNETRNEVIAIMEERMAKAGSFNNPVMSEALANRAINIQINSTHEQSKPYGNIGIMEGIESKPFHEIDNPIYTAFDESIQQSTTADKTTGIVLTKDGSLYVTEFDATNANISPHSSPNTFNALHGSASETSLRQSADNLKDVDLRQTRRTVSGAIKAKGFSIDENFGHTLDK